jgi:hypothetical protein
MRCFSIVLALYVLDPVVASAVDTGNDQVILVTPGGTDAAQVRLRVANRPGKDTADDVVVMVTEVQRRAVSEQATAESRPIGLPLTWSGSNPPFSVACVHPGSQRHIDLLHVDMSAGDEKVPAQFDLMPKPAGGRDLLESGTYEISVELRARNADAVGYPIPVRWDGGASGDAEIWDHLHVEEPRKVR